MLEVGDTGSEDQIASLIGDLVDLQMSVASAVAGARAIDGAPTRRAVNFVAPGAAPAVGTAADPLRAERAAYDEVARQLAECRARMAASAAATGGKGGGKGGKGYGRGARGDDPRAGRGQLQAGRGRWSG